MSSDKNEDTANEHFRVAAMVNLPLSAQCHPAVHFDGRWFVLFGRDHIGLIILVYHILGTRYNQVEFEKVENRKTLPSRGLEEPPMLRVGWRNLFSSCAVVSVFCSGGK